MDMIRKFLRRVLGFPISPKPSQVLYLPEPVEWTIEDANRWKSFLNTPTGQNLWKKARAMQVAHCVNACSGSIEPKLAGGISFTVDWFEKLTISGESPVKDSQTETGSLENAELSNELSYV